ncbi:MAG: diguanylate cyclase, partial [Gammaproteobacteria bacterium]|nr:diguanylate cyclase [Gammaproteobacteria bacterium]
RLENLFIQQLQHVPQLDAMFLATPDGGFQFLKRTGTAAHGGNSGFFYKHIMSARPESGTPRRVSLHWRDSALAITRRGEDPQDAFDARLRPWYRDALLRGGLTWTDPYVFHTSRMPGLTVATPLYARDGTLRAVLGADVELSALSRFLATQELNVDGDAVIVHRNGSVIAHPSFRALQPLARGDVLALPRMQQLDSQTRDALTQFEREGLEVEKLAHPAQVRFESSNVAYVGTFRPFLDQARWPWLMGVFVPDSRFVGGLRESLHQALLIALVVTVLITVAAFVVGIRLMRPIMPREPSPRTDPETGLLDRAGFERDGQRLLLDSDRQGQAIGLALFEIDEFARLGQGDDEASLGELLGALASRIHAEVDQHDLLARYDRKSFALLLPGTGLDDARKVAERVRERIARYPIRTDSGLMSVTLSAGIAVHDRTSIGAATLHEPGKLAAARGRSSVTLVDLIADADRALRGTTSTPPPADDGGA